MHRDVDRDHAQGRLWEVVDRGIGRIRDDHEAASSCSTVFAPDITPCQSTQRVRLRYSCTCRPETTRSRDRAITSRVSLLIMARLLVSWNQWSSEAEPDSLPVSVD